MIEITADIVRSLIPSRDEAGHKGTFGTALVIAGSRYMTGAGVLATGSCLRSGVGMVKYLSEEEALLPVQINCPCALTSSLGKDVKDAVRSLKQSLPKTSACLIGPGCDAGDEKICAALTFVLQEAKAVVIDASALTVISEHKEHFLPLISGRTDKGLLPAILTPHPGEFARLTGSELAFGEEGCRAFAEKNKCVLVLKGNDTFISDAQGECYVNIGSNSGLAKGGSGDVLAGLMTGLYAQGMAPLDAAIAAVFIHSLCGKYAAEQKGVRAMLPSDLAGFFPEVLNGILNAR